MRKFIPSIVAASTIVFAASVEAAPKASAPAPVHSENLARMLNLRLKSIEVQIDILEDGVIGREEAQDLRAEARRLEDRLQRSSEREAAALEPQVERLQQHLRLAADDARLGTLTSRRRDLGRFDDGEKYEGERDSYYDRHEYQRADPRGDPFAKWEERDEREPH